MTGIRDWIGPATIRQAREIAKRGGHDMTPLREGVDTAFASCRNPGCTVMLEIRGPGDWRFIRLGAPHERCNWDGSPSTWAVRDVPEEG